MKRTLAVALSLILVFGTSISASAAKVATSQNSNNVVTQSKTIGTNSVKLVFGAVSGTIVPRK